MPVAGAAWVIKQWQWQQRQILKMCQDFSKGLTWLSPFHEVSKVSGTGASSVLVVEVCGLEWCGGVGQRGPGRDGRQERLEKRVHRPGPHLYSLSTTRIQTPRSREIST